MSTDFHLEDNRVVAEGHVFRVSGEDLELRSPSRLHRANRSDAERDAPRRALVHGSDDKLIVNFGGDYTETEVHGALRVQRSRRTNVPAIYVMDGQGNAAVSLVGAGGGVVSCKDVTLKGMPYGGKEGTDSLLRTINWLHKRVEALERKAGVPARAFPTDQRG